MVLALGPADGRVSNQKSQVHLYKRLDKNICMKKMENIMDDYFHHG